MSNDIIDKIEKNKVKKYKKFQPIMNINIDYKLEFITEGLSKFLKFYTNNNKLLIVGKYNFYGIFQKSTGLWVWAKSIPGISKSTIKNIDKLKSFNYLFEMIDNIKSNFYYQLLTQDVIIIKNEIELEWINDLLLYLSGDIFYFNPVNSEQNIQFLTLKNIKEKYI